MGVMGLFLVINYFLCICMVLLRSLVLCDLYRFFSAYGVCFGPLEVGYTATRDFDSGWIEYFGGQGLYWVLFNLGKINR
jgi:hypothetical protein